MRLAPLALALVLPFAPAAAQNPTSGPTFPAHRVIGNLYYVGTYDLACFLITSDQGHILINTGYDDSAPMINKSIESLGFKLSDVKILLTTQAHADHTAALAEIKEKTGAEMWATAADKPLLEDGGFSDPHFGGKRLYEPIKVSHVIHDGDVIKLGDIRLTAVETPGHTNGSVSYTMKVSEGGRDYNVGIINMASINPGKVLTGKPTYPGVAGDFAQTFLKQRALNLDVWVSSHAKQYNLHEKYKPGQALQPRDLRRPGGLPRRGRRVREGVLRRAREGTRPLREPATGPVFARFASQW